MRSAPFALAVLALVLSACSSPMRVFDFLDGSQATDDVQSTHSGGIYKVGNPYTVAGRRYVPRVQPNYREYGIASWYGPQFHGKRTANGEIFNQFDVTAAHKTLPLPSTVRVTNLDNGRQLVVRVNDRGPFVGDRIIDLSLRSAQLLGVDKAGLASVLVELIDSGPHLLAAQPAAEPIQSQNQASLVRDARIFVQMGVFRVAENARNLAREISRFGQPRIYLKEAEGLHQVAFGPFRSAVEADTLVQTLERAGYRPYVVWQSF